MRDFQAELDEFIAGNPICMIYFYNDHCASCRSLRPKLVAMLQSHHPDVPLEKVDTAISPRLAGNFDVFSSPLIIIFAEGREYRRFSKYISVEEIEGILSKLKVLMS